MFWPRFQRVSPCFANRRLASPTLVAIVSMRLCLLSVYAFLCLLRTTIQRYNPTYLRWATVSRCISLCFATNTYSDSPIPCSGHRFTVSLLCLCVSLFVSYIDSPSVITIWTYLCFSYHIIFLCFLQTNISMLEIFLYWLFEYHLRLCVSLSLLCLCLVLSLLVSLTLHTEQVDITDNPHFGNHSLGGVGVLRIIWWTHVSRGW